MNKNKGITLIALVITIMMMVILASVAVNLSMGENGVIERSEGTKLESLRAEIFEKIQNETKTAINEFGEYSQILAINNLLENYDETEITELIVETNGRLGITFKEEKFKLKYFVSNRGEVTAVSEYVYEKENATYAIKSRIGSEEKNAYDLLAPVPLGFVASKIGAEITPKEYTVNSEGMVDVTVTNANNISVSDQYYFGEDRIEHGLVIYEGKEKVYNLDEEELKEVQENRNQFVWIPVNEDDLNSMLVVDENGDLYFKKEKRFNVKLDSSGKESPSTKIRYIVEPYFDYEFISIDDKDIESNFFKSLYGNDLDNEELLKKFNTTLRKDFNNMINSIKKYGGFYVDRDFTKKGTTGINWMNWWKKYNNRNKESIYYNNENFYTNTIYQIQYELIKKFTDETVFLNLNNVYKYFYSDYSMEYTNLANTETDATMVKNIKRLNYKYLIITQGMVVDNSKFEGEFELDSENKLTFSATNLNFVENYAFSKFAIDKEDSVIVNEKGDFIIKKIDYKIPYTYTFYANNNGSSNNTWAVVDKIEGNINLKANKITGKIFLKFYNDISRGSEELNTNNLLKEMIKEFSGTIDLENKKFYGETNYKFINVVYAGGKSGHSVGMEYVRLRHSWNRYSDASSRMTLYMK